MNRLMKKISILILCVLVIMWLVVFINSITLKINVLEIIKTNILGEPQEINNGYDVYIDKFFKEIETENYEAAYNLTDEENTKFKFGTFENFKNKLQNICFIDGVYNENNVCVLGEIIEKDKFDDLSFEMTYYDYTGETLENKTIEAVLRVYEDDTYKLYITDYTED